jgi:hypothetical protein
MIKQPCLAALCAAALAGHAAAETEIYQKHERSFTNFTNAFQIVLPVAGLTASLALQDYEGVVQLTEGFLTQTALVQAMKYGFNRQRPYGGSRSFPSGHTASAFSGASYIHFRYGDKFAIPVYALAAAVGIARVHGNYHFMDDVVAGASIAVLSNLLYSTDYPGIGARFTPHWGRDGFGLSFTYQFGDDQQERSSKRVVKAETLENDFDFSVGLSYQSQIHFDAQGAANDLNIEQSKQHITEVRWRLAGVGGTKVHVQFQPFSTRVETELEDSWRFGDTFYAPGTTLVQAIDDYRASLYWSYDVLPFEDWDLDLGLGSSLRRFEARFDALEGKQLSRLLDYMVYYEALARFEFRTHGVKLYTEWTSGLLPQTENQGYRLSGKYGLGYQITPQWSIRLEGGLQRTQQIIYKERASYDVSQKDQYAALAIGYRF